MKELQTTSGKENYLNTKKEDGGLFKACISLLIFALVMLSAASLWASKQGSISIVGLTEEGHNVVVRLSELNGDRNDVTITFNEVTKIGITKLMKSDPVSLQSPSQFKLRVEPFYYSIKTTAEYQNGITLCIDYKDKDILKEGALRLFHHENGSWAELKTELDYRNNVICGVSPTLSDFVLFEDPRYLYGPLFWGNRQSRW